MNLVHTINRSIQEQKHLLRNAILQQLEAAEPASLPVETLFQGIYFLGFEVSEKILIKELDYLLDKAFIRDYPHPINPSFHRYKLSASGREYLEGQGLA